MTQAVARRRVVSSLHLSMHAAASSRFNTAKNLLRTVGTGTLKHNKLDLTRPHTARKRPRVCLARMVTTRKSRNYFGTRSFAATSLSSQVGLGRVWLSPGLMMAEHARALSKAPVSVCCPRPKKKSRGDRSERSHRTQHAQRRAHYTLAPRERSLRATGRTAPTGV